MIWLYLRYSSLVGSIINPVTNYQHTNLISSMNSSNISGNLPEKKIRQLQSFLTHTKFSQDHINKIESPHEFMGKNLHLHLQNWVHTKGQIMSMYLWNHRFSKIPPKKIHSDFIWPLKGQLISEGNFGVFKSHKKWTKFNEGFLKWVEQKKI